MNTKLRSILFALIALFVCACQQKGSLTIENLEAGSLANRIPSNQMMDIKSLTISGELNGTDIRVIREMATKGVLTSLDIQKTDIVAGGEQYYDEYSTKNDVLGIRMFYLCHINTIKLPASVKTLEHFALSGTNIETIDIPTSCKEVENAVFFNCPNLKSIYIPANTESWGGNNNEKSPSFLEHIVDENNPYLKAKDGILYSKDGSRLISCPAAIKQVNIPTDVKNIEANAFSYIEGITQLKIPTSVTHIGYWAFGGCKNLKDIILSDSIQTIETDVFHGCNKLESIKLGKNVTLIDNSLATPPVFSISVDAENPRYLSKDGILYSKDGTTILTCPRKVAPTIKHFSSVSSFGACAFAGNEAIESFNIPPSVQEIGPSCFKGSNVKHIKLNNKEIKIALLAFYDCDSLESFQYPDGMREIDCNFFCLRKLHSLYLPQSATRIDFNLIGCSSLDTIKCYVTNPKEVVRRVDFEGISDSCTWIVPKGAAKSYKDCEWWRSSWQIKEL